jgi:hypothetical protein
MLLLAWATGALGACAASSPDNPSLASIRLDDLDAPAAASAPAISKRRPGVRSPIAQICAYPGGKQVLDDDLPGLTARPEYAFFQNMSLKALQRASGGRLKADDLMKVDADLRALP